MPIVLLVKGPENKTGGAQKGENVMDEQEARRLVDNYSDMILRLSLNYLKSRQEAEDICQNVFLKYMSTKVSFQSEEHEKAWMIRTTINACKDVLKSAYHQRMVVTEDVWSHAQWEEDAYEEVREAVFLLPERYRSAIYLYYFEGYSTKEIAKILGKTQNSVSLSLSRGRKRLRNMLESQGKGWVNSYGK